jgi:hypothetical protein
MTWYDNLFQIPLVPVVRNNNTETILVKRPPSEYLPARPPPHEAIFNVYELKTQPELVRYLHASAGFPTKPTWLRAVKNRQYASWPGLTPEAIVKHFPESEETLKGHARKTKSGQRSTKRMPEWEDNLIDEHDADAEAEITRPTTKNATSLSKSTTTRAMKPSSKCTRTKQAVSPRSQAEETNVSWSLWSLTATQFWSKV